MKAVLQREDRTTAVPDGKRSNFAGNIPGLNSGAILIGAEDFVS
jgi:hypothetical protein